MSYINLALPGKSVSSIINNLYSYFREYGHPKKVFCLFPNFNRFELPINKDIIISGGENISSVEIENTLYKHPSVLFAAVVLHSHNAEDEWQFTKLYVGFCCRLL